MGVDFIHEPDSPQPIEFDDLPEDAQQFFGLCVNPHEPIPDPYAPRCRLYGRNGTHYDGNVKNVLDSSDSRTQLSMFLTLMASNHNIEAIGLSVEGKAITGELADITEEQKKALMEAAQAGSMEDALENIHNAGIEPELCDMIHVNYETRTRIYTGLVIMNAQREAVDVRIYSSNIPRPDAPLGALQGFYARANKLLLQGLDLLQEEIS